MNRSLLILGLASVIAVFAAGCSATAPNYSPYMENMRALKAQGAGVNKISSAVTANKNLGDMTCRLSMLVALPEGATYETYIDNALKSELQAAGVYEAASPQKATVELQSVTFNSNIGFGSWTIEGTARVGNDAPFPVAVKHKFDASYAFWQACADVANAFVPATQEFLNTLINAPQFQALLKGQ